MCLLCLFSAQKGRTVETRTYMTARHVSDCAAMCEPRVAWMHVRRMACCNACGQGGGTPYSLSALTYGGGDENVHVQKGEEMGRVRNGIKWRRERDGWSERGNEGRAPKEKRTPCSRRHHFYTQTVQFGHCSFRFKEAVGKEYRLIRQHELYNNHRIADNEQPTPITHRMLFILFCFKKQGTTAVS